MSILKTYPFTLCATVVVLSLSLFPMPQMPELKDVPMADKWAHFVMYGCFSLAMWIDVFRDKRIQSAGRKLKIRWYDFLFATVMPIVLGGLLELIQPFVNRGCELMDFYADAIGVALGTLIALIFAMFYRARA